MQSVSIDMNSTDITKEIAHTRHAWMVVLTASFFFLYIFIQLNLFNSIDIQLMQTFHLSALELGNLSSMFFYSNALFLFPAGVLLDRVSPKKIIIASLTLAIIGTFLFGITNVYLVACAARFIVGIASAFCFLSCIRLASRWFPPKKMAFVSGVIVTMAMIGGLIAQTPMAVLSSMVGWRNAVLMDGGLGIFILLAILTIVKDHPPHIQEKAVADMARIQNLGFWRSIQYALLNPQNWFGGIYTAFLNLPVFLLGAIWGIHYVMQVHQVTLMQASYATTAFFMGVIFGAPAFGWLSDYIGRRVMPMTIGAIASIIVVLILMYAPHLSLTELIVLFFLIGFVTSSQVLSYPLIAESNPSFLTGTAISVASSTIMSSGFIFQPLFGLAMGYHWDHRIVDGVPVYSAGDFLNAMLIIPIGFVIGLVMTWMMKETYCKSPG